MKRLVSFAALASLLTLLISFGTPATAAPAPFLRYSATFDTETMAGPFDEILRVRAFAPGAWTPIHIHGGTVHVTVLEGELTLRIGGTDHIYKAGESWVEMPGDNHAHAVGNTGTVKASGVGTTLLPKGATETTNVGSVATPAPPGPTVVYETTNANVTMTVPFNVVHKVTDFAPGAFTALHHHGGPVLVLVLTGTLTVRQAGAVQTYAAGQHFVEETTFIHDAGNLTDTPVSITATTLLPQGVEQTTLVPPTAVDPRTHFVRRLGDG
ncbi:MAG: cupin domain-containing protein [Thermomicrobiales bacterium]